MAPDRLSPPPLERLAGRCVVVTGASDGIGAAAARRLRDADVDVVVVGRSPEKTGRLAAELGVDAEVADFTRLDDVRRLAASLRRRRARIDVLVNNAGVLFRGRRATVDGYERTFQVNHLAPYLLTRLLEDRLRAGGDGRVVTTSSGANVAGHLRAGDLVRTARPRAFGSGFLAYATSKLANVVFTAELARRWPDVAATSFHPGVVASRFGHAGPAALVYRTPVAWFLRSPEEGADTMLWLASAPESDGWHNGLHFEDRHVGRTAPAAHDAELGRRLWDLSADLTGVAR